MKKILIIEDGRATAEAMAVALDGLGEIILCTKQNMAEVNFDFRKMVMPPQSEVVKLIAEADIILLDNNLDADYCGKDLLPYCEGKKVIGISNEHSFGTVNFTGKEYLSPSYPHVAAELRSLVMGEVMEKETSKLLIAIKLIEKDNVNAYKEVIDLVGVECARALYAYRVMVDTDAEHVFRVLEVGFREAFYPGK